MSQVYNCSEELANHYLLDEQILQKQRDAHTQRHRDQGVEEGVEHDFPEHRIVEQQRRVVLQADPARRGERVPDRKSTRLNSSHVAISYAVFCLKKKSK